MAGAAGHPDVAHAAAPFGPLPGGRADAGLPADLGAPGPQPMAERAELGFVFENRYWHEDDHAPGRADKSRPASGSEGRLTRWLPRASTGSASTAGCCEISRRSSGGPARSTA